MKKLLYIFLFLPVFAPAQVQMFFTSDSSAFITSPLDVDSLFYWFDASQGVFDSIGNPISNFQGVGEWKDLSGRGHHVTQGTNGARPQYQATGGPNNYPALYFDGSNDFLASAAHLWESDDLTVFVVMKFFNTTRNTLEAIISKDESASTSQWRIGSRPASESYALYVQKSSNGTLSPASVWNGYGGSAKFTDYKIWTTTWPTSAPEGWINSSSFSYSALFTSSGPNTIYDATEPLRIGVVRSTPAQHLQGYISEIIVFSRALTTTERPAIEAYLNHKYKIY